jgi:hypothetical protein
VFHHMFNFSEDWIERKALNYGNREWSATNSATADP